MPLNLSALVDVLKYEYRPAMIRQLMSPKDARWELGGLDEEEAAKAFYGWRPWRIIGPLERECMPAFMDPSNVWYWLPEDYEEECDCES